MPGQKAPEEHRRRDILGAAYDVAVRHGIEALTVRAVAARAAVSHGTVLFHFKRRDELVVALLGRVLDATTVLRIPADVVRLTRPATRLRTLLRAEMERLSGDPRHFRLFLEYWALGVRDAMIRRRVSAALDGYRRAFRAVSESVADEDRAGRRRTKASRRKSSAVSDGLAAVAVSLVHGCALQAVIDRKSFSVHQHFESASGLLEGLGVTARGAARSEILSAPLTVDVRRVKTQRRTLNTTP
ncbi:MAG TPA: TetR/AcrR family transcriptional regulator [Gemmatimonadaceae bacterium]|jgi:AcrR family transcriptional regulator